MALKAKELGFTALVLTDHFYGNDKSYDYCSMNIRTDHLLRQFYREASEVLPVIRGMEVPIGGEEVLVFGGGAIKQILDKGGLSFEFMDELRVKENCAFILCHPHLHYEELIPHVDGYERYNSMQDQFSGRLEELPKMDGMQAWCNSDAHSADSLDWAWNIVNKKIETETDLIRYIKRGKDHEFHIMDLD
jgi:predicted metal-dependent phosphoesterase TrpH